MPYGLDSSGPFCGRDRLIHHPLLVLSEATCEHAESHLDDVSVRSKTRGFDETNVRFLRKQERCNQSLLASPNRGQCGPK